LIGQDKEVVAVEL